MIDFRMTAYLLVEKLIFFNGLNMKTQDFFSINIFFKLKLGY
jgi:hypothetical protein